MLIFPCVKFCEPVPFTVWNLSFKIFLVTSYSFAFDPVVLFKLIASIALYLIPLYSYSTWYSPCCNLSRSTPSNLYCPPVISEYIFKSLVVVSRSWPSLFVTVLPFLSFKYTFTPFSPFSPSSCTSFWVDVFPCVSLIHTYPDSFTYFWWFEI